jgi:hypothetical protein
LGELFAEVEGGLSTPLYQDRFYLEPQTVIHVAPALLGSGAAGLGVSFW